MQKLLVISILAVLALLWASISIAQHVRRARRRRRRMRESEAARGTVGLMGLSRISGVSKAPGMSFTEVTPFEEASVERLEPVRSEAVSPEAGVAAPIEMVEETERGRPMAFETAAVVEAAPAAVEIAAAEPESVPQSMETPAVAEASEPETQEAVHVVDRVAERAPAMVEAEPEPNSLKDLAARAKVFPKPVRALGEKHPLAALAGKMERTDWEYFNKDLGDLTDPYEGPRQRSKNRPGR